MTSHHCVNVGKSLTQRIVRKWRFVVCYFVHICVLILRHFYYCFLCTDVRKPKIYAQRIIWRAWQNSQSYIRCQTTRNICAKILGAAIYKSIRPNYIFFTASQRCKIIQLHNWWLLYLVRVLTKTIIIVIADNQFDVADEWWYQSTDAFGLAFIEWEDRKS